MILLKYIINLKKKLKDKEVITIFLSEDLSIDIGKKDKLIPDWSNNYIIHKFCSKYTGEVTRVIPINKIILITHRKYTYEWRDE